jgi:arylsulfatase
MTQDGRNPAWESLPEERREDLAHRMAVYAAMVERMDHNIGRLTASLRNRGELENTLVVFLSDNGACGEWDPYGFDLDPRAYDNNRPGHGINSHTPNMSNTLHTGDMLETMGGPDSLFSVGCGWANLSNTPLNFYKHYAHEGGIRTPMIAHWPARIRKPGRITRHVAHVMDIMATLIEVGDASYPQASETSRVLPLEGKSLVPAFSGEAKTDRVLLYEHERNIALRDGDWKLVAHNAVHKEGLAPNARWELYNLNEDVVERNNVATEHPERVERMIRLLEQEARRTLVFPAP